MSDRSIEGGCLCGAVRYRLTGEVQGFQYCHCSRCRRFTGSAHAANLFVKPDKLEWMAGEDLVGTWVLEADPQFPTAFCKRCGSSMPSMSATGRYWVVPAGGVDGDPGARPARSIFWDSRAPWYEHVSDLPRHGEWPDAK
ncbi:GFA family protein [Engelhardtia mirabilis]|uniref:Glutathione-dependent formaldehyde-activating enzyme n=1 Tax=Engelhardtia mirabilis TaxID=2528011 RepID=A0A518BEB6_9BACT|nr:Glutathione-dependent formaldehyde-activating enzyme [Planctomycetes bacterium Pla133]QDU99655.1 Glutathione-dependent formaldehyde-activating enzyme [Planctomycetes bacterium Pla86]